MKKTNWILFFLISALVYVAVISNLLSERKEYEHKKRIYDAQVARVKDEEAQREAIRKAELAATEKEAKALLKSTVTNITDGEATPEVQAVRNKLSKLLTPEAAPKHVLDTPLYRVVFTELGARPISWEVKTSKYVRNIGLRDDGTTTNTVQLIPQVGDPAKREYPLSFVGSTARDFNTQLFHLEQTESSGTNVLSFVSDPVDGLVARKTYTFHPDSYLVDLHINFDNKGQTRQKLGREQGYGIGWQGGFGDPEIADRAHGTVQAVFAVAETIRTHTVARADQPYTLATTAAAPIGWAGQEKKFFAALLLPGPENPASSMIVSFDDRHNDDVIYQTKGIAAPQNIDIYHPTKALDLKESADLKYQLYVGPKNLEAMKSKSVALPPGVATISNLVFHQMPFGITALRSLCIMFLGLMRYLHGLFGAWGLAIIGTTITVRILIYPLTHWAIKNQARTMIEQQKIKPEMEEIQKKYAKDATKKNQAMMQLYRDHGVNPLGFVRGCIPMLLQMPVFLTLYVVFEQSVELRGQSFLWVQDLSGPDRLFHWGPHLWLIGNSFNILPIIMAVTNYIQMRIMQMPASDETQAAVQKQMLVMMPIMFTFFLYQLPAGLIVYWIVSNTISIGQSIMTKRIIASHMAEHEKTKAAIITTPAAPKKK